MAQSEQQQLTELAQKLMQNPEEFHNIRKEQLDSYLDKTSKWPIGDMERQMNLQWSMAYCVFMRPRIVTLSTEQQARMADGECLKQGATKEYNEKHVKRIQDAEKDWTQQQREQVYRHSTNAISVGNCAFLSLNAPQQYRRFWQDRHQALVAYLRAFHRV